MQRFFIFAQIAQNRSPPATQAIPRKKYLFKNNGTCESAPHAHRQIDRRVLQGERIPHEEKVFSLFQPHTEWISKGKAGVPVELGLRVCVMEDRDRFILHHQVMEKRTDDQAAMSMVDETRERFPTFRTPELGRYYTDIISRAWPAPTALGWRGDVGAGHARDELAGWAC